MNYRVTGLSPEPFQHLYGLPDDVLAKIGVKRYLVDKKPGFPDRVAMRDMEPARPRCCSITSRSRRRRPIAQRTRSSSAKARRRPMMRSMSCRR